MIHSSLQVKYKARKNLYIDVPISLQYEVGLKISPLFALPNGLKCRGGAEEGWSKMHNSGKTIEPHISD